MTSYLKIAPRDVLFFRDARPISGSNDGFGATWPLPSVLHSSVLSALYRAFPQEAKKRLGTKLTAFSGVKTLGPFPMKNGEILFPTPADLVLDGKDSKMCQLLPTKVAELPACKGNLPTPLKYPLWTRATPTKKQLGAWISASGLEKYLRGDISKIDSKKEIFSNCDVFDTESRPGIGINAETGTTKDGAFYSASYLRLKSDVAMVAAVDVVSRERDGVDFWKKFMEDSSENAKIVFGGQRGVASVSELSCNPFSCKNNEITGTTRVKWTLLSPAYFRAGWLPGFIDAKGCVSLSEMPARAPNEKREAWRKRCAGSGKIGAKLVAARIPKPMVVSGWKLKNPSSQSDCGGEPKATKLFVPAGAVFYFECETEGDARRLVQSLHWRVKSDLLGEQGFGLGVCSSWEMNEGEIFSV